MCKKRVKITVNQLHRSHLCQILWAQPELNRAWRDAMLINLEYTAFLEGCDKIHIEKLLRENGLPQFELSTY